MADSVRFTGRLSDLAGGLKVRRVLPNAVRRSVGPFVFFDHFGPVTLAPDVDSDVGAHPHIGLATVTYLFDGGFTHRDSLGTVQSIMPGAVNWMVAGSGIVHSERTPESGRGLPRRLHGLQLWVALPPALETMAPSFQHVAAADIPYTFQSDGVKIRVLVGQAFGLLSPVRTASPTLYLDMELPAGTACELPVLAPEMAIYSPLETFTLNGDPIQAQEMVITPSDASVVVRAEEKDSRLIVIGGAALEKPVRMWWNFVATDRSRIAAAAKRWADGGFEPIAGEADRVEAPDWVD